MKFIDYLEKGYDYTRFNPIGDFQKKNLKMAIKACELLGLNRRKISKCIHKLKSVKGRLELVKEFPDKTKVFIDFYEFKFSTQIPGSQDKSFNFKLSLTQTDPS